MKEVIMLRSKAKRLEPVLRVGKGGLSNSLIEELKKVLNKRKLVKIKLLKSSCQKPPAIDWWRTAIANVIVWFLSTVGIPR